MDQNRVCIAAFPDRERVAAANGNNVNIDAACGFEQWQDMAEETGVSGRGRRTKRDKTILRLSRGG